MPNYVLTPRKDRLEMIKASGRQLDMLVEGSTVFAMLKGDFSPKRESLEEYVLKVPEKKIKFRLSIPLNMHLYDFLSKYWKIKKK